MASDEDQVVNMLRTAAQGTNEAQQENAVKALMHIANCNFSERTFKLLQGLPLHMVITGIFEAARQAEAAAAVAATAAAMNHQSGASGAGAGVSAQHDVVAAFKRKLAECNIDRPDAQGIQRVILHFGSALQAAAAPSCLPETALAIYDAALQLPGTGTRCRIKQQLNISLNGPWVPEHCNIISGVDMSTGHAVIVKLLATHESHLLRATTAERHAARVLQLAEPTVPLVATELVDLEVLSNDQGPAFRPLGVGAGPRSALKMPWYVGSLATLPQHTEGRLLLGGRRIQTALCYMHERNLVHMDVKADNIFMSAVGDWFLGDFGSSTELGTSVWSYTKAWYPYDIMNTPACVEYDWGMLLTTMAVLMDKDNLRALTMHEAARVDKSMVLQRCAAAKFPDMLQFLHEIAALAGWEL